MEAGELWLVNRTDAPLSIRLRRVGANDPSGHTVGIWVADGDAILAPPRLYGIADGASFEFAAVMRNIEMWHAEALHFDAHSDQVAVFEARRPESGELQVAFLEMVARRLTEPHHFRTGKDD